MNAEAVELLSPPASAGGWLQPKQRTGWLQPMLTNWPRAACRRLRNESVVVRALIAEVRGSAPREAGACMLIGPRGLEGTIGGGHLEWYAVSEAQRVLDSSGVAAGVHRLTLGAQLAQCCGGAVQLWMETFTETDLPWLERAAEAAESGAPAIVSLELSRGRVARGLPRHAFSDAGSPSDRVCLSVRDEGCATLMERLDSDRTSLWLYGAGHVGQAVVRTLAELPFQVTWVDSRAELFPVDLPDSVRVLCTDAASDAIREAPPAARHLVMTHDHALDYALTHAILMRNQFAWLGLIGSESKGARFRSRLRRDGVAPELIERLVCPIGIEGLHSKLPAAIAIGVSAQLLQLEATKTSQPIEISTAQAGDCAPTQCASCGSHPRPLR